MQCLSGPCCQKCQVSCVAGVGMLHSLGIAPVPTSPTYMPNVKQECNGTHGGKRGPCVQPTVLASALMWRVSECRKEK